MMNLKPALLIGALLVAASTSAFADAQTSAKTMATQESCMMLNMATTQMNLGKKEQRAANRELARRVHSQLYSTKGLQSTNIVVFAMADTGQVVLAGYVEDPEQDRLAEDAAKKVAGVNGVSSTITLREQGS